MYCRAQVPERRGAMAMGMPNSQGTPPLDGILETPVYVEDAERADRFYAGVLGLTRMSAGPRIQAYSGGRPRPFWSVAAARPTTTW